MFGLGVPLFVAVCLGGLIVLLGVGTLLFQAGCALADVPERGYFRALPIYSVAVVVCLPLAVVLIGWAGNYESDPNTRFGALCITALIVSLLLTWLVSGVIYKLLLAASFKKGLIVAGIELLLAGLLAALVSAVVLVILALVQIVSRPPPGKLSEIRGQRSEVRDQRSAVSRRPLLP
jgi:hypothetical protein